MQQGSPVLDESAERGADGSIGGFSVLRAADRAELEALLVGHPRRQVGSLQVLPYAPVGR